MIESSTEFPPESAVPPQSMGAFRWIDAITRFVPSFTHKGRGRFGDGTRYVAYFAESAAGAVAEFLRRHPEFLYQQENLNIRVYKVDLSVPGTLLDVRTEALAAAAGVRVERLTSSEQDEQARFQECWALAARADEALFVGILYQSAAARWTAWNVALFGKSSEATWRVLDAREVDVPQVHRDLVRPLLD